MAKARARARGHGDGATEGVDNGGTSEGATGDRWCGCGGLEVGCPLKLTRRNEIKRAATHLDSSA
jgi:hypothetical protein